MKCNFLILTAIAFVLGIAFSGCKKDTPENVIPKITDDNVELTATTATFTWTVDWPGKLISVVEVSGNEDMSKSRIYGSESETENHSFTVTVTDLEEATKYYYRFLVWNRNFVDNKFVMEKKNFIIPTFNGHEFVDLGLPSGTLWAVCNVGADSPEGYGGYYAWGEITTKSSYVWSNYRHCDGSSYMFTKYCNVSEYGNNGFTDNLSILLPEDDAVIANWGVGWCMPTREQWIELKGSTTNTWTTQNGVNGLLITAKNGNSLFLPAASGSSLGSPGSQGYYWSSSLKTGDPRCAWGFSFLSSYCNVDGNYRSYGSSVRAVRSARQN